MQTTNQKIVQMAKIFEKAIEEGDLSIEVAYTALAHNEGVHRYVKVPFILMAAQIDRNFTWQTGGKWLTIQPGSYVLMSNHNGEWDIWGVEQSIFRATYSFVEETDSLADYAEYRERSVYDVLTSLDGKVKTQYSFGFSGQWREPKLKLVSKSSGLLAFRVEDDELRFTTLESAPGDHFVARKGQVVCIGGKCELWARDYADFNAQHVDITEVQPSLEELLKFVNRIAGDEELSNQLRQEAAELAPRLRLGVSGDELHINTKMYMEILKGT